MSGPATTPEEPRSATPGEQAAFRLGITVAIDMALAAADAIEARPDAGNVRQQAAVAALQGLAEGLVGAMLEPRDVERHCFGADMNNDRAFGREPVE